MAIWIPGSATIRGLIMSKMLDTADKKKITALDAEAMPKYESMASIIWRRFRRHPGAVVGLVVLSIIIMLVSIGVAVWAATKIFRTGILMYGKRPGLKEIAKWVRYK